MPCFPASKSKLEQFHGNLSRAAVELAKDWRTDRSLRHLEAVMIVADDKNSFLIAGNGDLIEPDDGLIAIGSGGPYALAAARALLKYTDLSAREIAEEAMQIAGEDLHLHERQRVCGRTLANARIELIPMYAMIRSMNPSTWTN